MASPGADARLFVALDPPDDARAELIEWRERAFARRDDVRLVDPAALHVTLAFLGNRPEEEIPAIGAVVREATAGCGAPLLAGVGVRPVPPRRPRLFALDLADDGGKGAAVQAAVAGALAAAGLYTPEERPFWPHVTLARIRRGVRAAAFDGPPPPATPWRAEAVTLYRSRLSPKGARYEPLERAPLVD